MRLQIYAATLLAVSASACSTARVHVLRKGEDRFQVVSRDYARDDAEDEAYLTAKRYCAQFDQRAVFMRDGTEYTGSMDEGTRNAIRGASLAAYAVGASTLGMIGYGMTSNRDRTQIDFRCVSVN